MRKLVTIIIILAVVAGLGGGAYYWYSRQSGTQTLVFRTAKVTRGDLLVTISATGTIEPEEVVDVGAQVAGQILSFGKDANGKTVDYGSIIDEGTVLANIDDSLYAADANQAKAQVQSSEASLQRAVADLGQMNAKLKQAERDWERAKKLGPSEALAQTSYDAYESAYEVAKANLGVGEAAILQAKAALEQSQSMLGRSLRNLGYCTIKSPVRGVIIDRRVNIGQTVVASLNAPSLFLIAKDLTRMQVWAPVNEADIGKIHAGLPVSFTVDAFPGQTFRGEVGKVRLNASMTQNVVTYTVEIVTDNSNGRLMPYLTANVQFELSNPKDVLLVPNSALRWTPQDEQIDPQFREAAASAPASRRSRTGQDGGEATSKPAKARGEKPTHGTVWVIEGKLVRPIRVRLGGTDGAMTEASGEGLVEGLEVVTGQQTQAAASSGGEKNPFMPTMPGRGGRPGGGGGGGGR